MRLLLQIVLFLLPLVAVAQPKIGYQKGQVVESPLVVQHGFRDGRRTEIPLPKGRWAVRYVGEVKSTTGYPGVNLWLEDIGTGKVAQFLTVQIYEAQGKNWQEGTNCDFLLSTPRGSAISGGCFGLSGGGIMNHATNAIQVTVREEYARAGIAIEKEALWLKGMADRRDGLATYFNYGIPFPDATKPQVRDFLARVRSGSALPPNETHLADWFRAYGQAIVDAVVGTNSRGQTSILGKVGPDLLKAAAPALASVGESSPQALGTSVPATTAQTTSTVVPSLSVCPPTGMKHNCSGEIDFGRGYSYRGEFRDGKPHGVGLSIGPNGERYEGYWANGERAGFGVTLWPGGKKYVGEHWSNLPNGLGIEYAADATVSRSGRWRMGFLESALVLEVTQFPVSTSLSTLPVAQVGAAHSGSVDGRKGLEVEQQLALERDRLVATNPNPQRESPSTAARPERRVALIIGNSTYTINPLSNPVNDASDLDVTLRNLGFKTTLVRDATISQMRNVTRQFAEDVASSDVALIFFAGHGIEAKGRNYLIPVSADIKHEYELEDQAYDAGRWLDMLESIKGNNRQRVNIVILDACRNNDLARGWRSASRGLARMDAPTGTFVAFATAPGRVALDGGRGQRNSPFTKNLLRAIQTPDLPIELMFKEVRRLVLEETKNEQVPWDNSSLVGDFVFKRSR